jgi:pSer/pThr/pTyr-binding forkhead associated (FHA) protein
LSFKRASRSSLSPLFQRSSRRRRKSEPDTAFRTRKRRQSLLAAKVVFEGPFFTSNTPSPGRVFPVKLRRHSSFWRQVSWQIGRGEEDLEHGLVLSSLPGSDELLAVFPREILFQDHLLAGRHRASTLLGPAVTLEGVALQSVELVVI